MAAAYCHFPCLHACLPTPAQQASPRCMCVCVYYVCASLCVSMCICISVFASMLSAKQCQTRREAACASQRRLRLTGKPSLCIELNLTPDSHAPYVLLSGPDETQCSDLSSSKMSESRQECENQKGNCQRHPSPLTSKSFTQQGLSTWLSR